MSQQLAQCIQINEYVKKDYDGIPVRNRKGNIIKKEVYTMVLEGKEFILFQSKYFKATIGKYYKSCVYVYPNKKARTHWEEMNN
jgi:hypothetical protein